MNSKLTKIIAGKKVQKTPENKKLENSLIVSIIIMFILNLIRIYDFAINPDNQGLPLPATLSLLLFFLFLWRLFRQGYRQISAWMIIGAYALPTIFCFIYWGADLQADPAYDGAYNNDGRCLFGL